MTPDKTLGQIAFEAYGDNREWKDWRGQPMPQWGDVRQEIRDAWEVAASAVTLRERARCAQIAWTTVCPEGTLFDNPISLLAHAIHDAILAGNL